MITRVGGAARALLPFVVVLAAWQAIAMVATGLKVIPTPLAVVEAFAGDLGIYGENVWATVSVAAKGFVIGNLAAVTLAVAFVHIAWAERLLLKIAVASFCVPLVAVAPILTVTLPGDGPQVALAVLSVFFTTLISVVLGLRSADPAALTVIRSMGGSS